MDDSDCEMVDDPEPVIVGSKRNSVTKIVPDPDPEPVVIENNTQAMDDSDCEMVDDPELVIVGSKRNSVTKIVPDPDPEPVVIDDQSDDDDDVVALPQDKKEETKPSKPLPQLPCLNPKCRNTTNLRVTGYFDAMHFKVQKKKRDVICASCAKESKATEEEMADRFFQGKFIFGGYEKETAEDVVDIDCDEEEDEEEWEDPYDKKMCIVRPKDIEEVMQFVSDNNLIEKQRDLFLEKIEKVLDKCEADFKECSAKLIAVEKGFDSTYQKLYQYVRAEVEELEPLHITTTIEVDVTEAEMRNYEELKVTQRKLNDRMVLEAHDVRGGDEDSSDVQEVKTVKSIVKKPALQADKDEVMAVERISRKGQNLPPQEKLQRPPLKENERVYAMTDSFTSHFVRGTVLKAKCLESVYRYTVRLDGSTKRQEYLGKQLAYLDKPRVQLPVSTRCLALYTEASWGNRKEFFAGVIAEPLKSTNKYRYLVFFDDGYASYVSHDNVRVMVHSSTQVYEDIEDKSVKDFVRKYLAHYPERPLVKLQQGQYVRTELNGKWLTSRVLEVDSNLVKMEFEGAQRTEWIYRGSTRHSTLYIQMQRRSTGVGYRRHNIYVAAARGKKKTPYVEYSLNDDEDQDVVILTDSEETPASQSGASSPVMKPRSVARKSTSSSIFKAFNVDSSMRNIAPIGIEHAGSLEKVRLPENYIKPKKFHIHQCGPRCFQLLKGHLDQMKGRNPLLLPILLSWSRVVMFKSDDNKRYVHYIAPCGRRLRSVSEVFRFLRVTRSILGIQYFTFDFWVSVMTEFKPEKQLGYIHDISYEKENVKISCVNSLSHESPPYVEYCTERLPTGGVNLNLDPEFLCGCDCEDDCMDQSKCQCWQLTLDGIRRDGEEGVNGYVYRRLFEQVRSGIFECNSKCKCSNTCLNRVVQHPLQCRLQMFKTRNRGWGIRCLDDMPQGAFICIYAGQLLTEAYADQDGKNYGDEYLAELDYIEVMESRKAGYESEAEMELEIEKSTPEDSDDDSDDLGANDNAVRVGRYSRDDDFTPSSRRGEKDNIWSNVSTRSRRSTTKKKEKPKEKSKPKKKVKNEKKRKAEEQLDEPECIRNYPSVRSYYNEDSCYIMDAKSIGNIGRYLNHSCTPNVFVQNVFVDTHDLRFPWVSFFALTYIQGGQELTWDYNYEVDSVPGKRLDCLCGTEECRGRLL